MRYQADRKECGERFACFNGRECIANAKKCDGYPDCTDSSDELNCGKDKLISVKQ